MSQLMSELQLPTQDWRVGASDGTESPPSNIQDMEHTTSSRSPTLPTQMAALLPLFPPQQPLLLFMSIFPSFVETVVVQMEKLLPSAKPIVLPSSLSSKTQTEVDQLTDQQLIISFPTLEMQVPAPDLTETVLFLQLAGPPEQPQTPSSKRLTHTALLFTSKLL